MARSSQSIRTGDPALSPINVVPAKLLSAYPIETYLANSPAVFDKPESSHRIYQAFREWSGLTPRFYTDQPSVEAPALTGNSRGYVVVTNHSAAAQTVTVIASSRLHAVSRVSRGRKNASGSRRRRLSRLILSPTKAPYSNGNSHSQKAPEVPRLIAGVDIGGTKIAVGMVDDAGNVPARRECPTDAPRGYANALGNIRRMLDAITHDARSVQDYRYWYRFNWPGLSLERRVRRRQFLPQLERREPGPGFVRIASTSMSPWKTMPMPPHSARPAGAQAGIRSADLCDDRDRHRHRFHHRWTFISRSGLFPSRNRSPPSRPFRSRLCLWLSRLLGIACGRSCDDCMDERASPSEYPHGRDLSAKRICELAVAGDQLAKRAVEREAHYLGLGLANLVTMFCPDAIVLGGSVMKSAPLFLSRIDEVIRRSCSLVPFDKTEITLASLGERCKSHRRSQSLVSPISESMEFKVNPDLAVPVSESSKASTWMTFSTSRVHWKPRSQVSHLLSR